jgi:hypothetical protein
MILQEFSCKQERIERICHEEEEFAGEYTDSGSSDEAAESEDDDD